MSDDRIDAEAADFRQREESVAARSGGFQKRNRSDLILS